MSAIEKMSHVGGHRLLEEAQRKSLEISRNPTDHNVGAVGAFVGGVAAACAVGVAIVHAPPAIAPILHAAPGMILAGMAGGYVAGVSASKAVREG
jgi:hypothetical protein